MDEVPTTTPHWLKLRPALYEPNRMTMDELVARYESINGHKVLGHRLGSVGILNTLPGPKYSLFRLNNRISVEDQSIFVDHVDSIHSAGLTTETTHQGVDFHQWWLGIWARYATFPFITKHTRDRKAGPTIQTLVRKIDSVFGRRVLPLLRQLDSETAASMSYHHRDLAALTVSSTEREALSDHKMMKKNGPYIETHEEWQRNTAYRMGGMGSVMAVAWGEGTSWHYDAKNDCE
jgi:hypothetical protein